MQTIDGEDYLDVGEVTALLRVKRETLYAYVSRGVLQSYRQQVGRQRLYKRSEVESLLAVRPSGTSQGLLKEDRLPYADTWTGDH
jgi:excisionase family DNA binding protein